MPSWGRYAKKKKEMHIVSRTFQGCSKCSPRGLRNAPETLKDLGFQGNFRVFFLRFQLVLATFNERFRGIPGDFKSVLGVSNGFRGFQMGSRML